MTKPQLTTKQRVAGWALWSLKYLAVSVLGGLVVAVGLPEQKVGPATEEAVKPLVCTDGWVPDAEAADKDARQAVFRSFADTPAGQVEAVPSQMFLWQMESKLTGKPTPLKDQNPTGSCVGFAATTTAERSLAAEIVARDGDPSEFAHFAEEVTYAGSKVQGARALGATVSRQDGSAGVFVKAYFGAGYGLVPEGKHGDHDLTQYSAARARSWNLSGPPPELLAVSKKYPVRDVAKVTNWQQCKKAIASGYGVMGCASWSYSGTRDSNGVSRPTSEGWSHAMAIDGYIVLPDGTEYGHVENSWSDLPDRNGNRSGQSYHTGPTGWGNPTTAGFWASADSLDRALRQGDSFALSGVTGFPSRNLNWFIQAEPRHRRFRNPLQNPLEVALAW